MLSPFISALLILVAMLQCAENPHHKFATEDCHVEEYWRLLTWTVPPKPFIAGTRNAHNETFQRLRQPLYFENNRLNLTFSPIIATSPADLYIENLSNMRESVRYYIMECLNILWSEYGGGQITLMFSAQTLVFLLFQTYFSIILIMYGTYLLFSLEVFNPKFFSFGYVLSFLFILIVFCFIGARAQRVSEYNQQIEVQQQQLNTRKKRKKIE